MKPEIFISSSIPDLIAFSIENDVHYEFLIIIELIVILVARISHKFRNLCCIMDMKNICEQQTNPTNKSNTYVLVVITASDFNLH